MFTFYMSFCTACFHPLHGLFSQSIAAENSGIACGTLEFVSLCFRKKKKNDRKFFLSRNEDLLFHFRNFLYLKFKLVSLLEIIQL